MDVKANIIKVQIQNSKTIYVWIHETVLGNEGETESKWIIISLKLMYIIYNII